MSVSLRTENIQTTIHALNMDFAGRRDMDGYDESKIIHIHRRNRAYVWNQEMQISCLDSILKGYYIPPIICCSRIVNGVERREVMEGGNRITTFRRILNNLVRMLTEAERDRVRSHPITLVVMRGLTNIQQREMFRRLNKNVKVSDGQLYAMSEEDSPLVREAISFLNDDDYPLRARITACFFDTKDKDNDGKKDLENAVALISGALNGVNYITKSFGRQEEMVESQEPVDRNWIVTTLGLLLDVFRMADEQSPLTDKRKLKAQWSVGKYLGAILYDLLTNTGNVLIMQQKWAAYLVSVRRGNMVAEEAIEIAGAQNLNPDKLKRKSYKVDVFLREKRLASETELKEIKHSEEVDEESDDGEVE
jgi:3-dehydroquinate dehydratase